MSNELLKVVDCRAAMRVNFRLLNIGDAFFYGVNEKMLYIKAGVDTALAAKTLEKSTFYAEIVEPAKIEVHIVE